VAAIEVNDRYMDIFERLTALEVRRVVNRRVVLHIRRDDEVVGPRILRETCARQLEAPPHTGRGAIDRGVEVDESCDVRPHLLFEIFDLLLEVSKLVVIGLDRVVVLGLGRLFFLGVTDGVSLGGCGDWRGKRGVCGNGGYLEGIERTRRVPGLTVNECREE